MAVTAPLGQYDDDKLVNIGTLELARRRHRLHPERRLPTYVTGGRTTVDGERNDDRRDNVRIGATLTLPVDRHNSVKLYGSTGVYTRRGPTSTSSG